MTEIIFNKEAKESFVKILMWNILLSKPILHKLSLNSEKKKIPVLYVLR